MLLDPKSDRDGICRVEGLKFPFAERWHRLLIYIMPESFEAGRFYNAMRKADICF